MLWKKNDGGENQQVFLGNEDERQGLEQQDGNVTLKPRYPKPKILLIDLDDESVAVLKAAGYTVAEGSFGAPYEVHKSSQYVSMVLNDRLPANYAEQEIVIADLEPAEAIKMDVSEGSSVTEEPGFWAKCSLGEIDPRPAVMVRYREELERILDHGGVYIVFLSSRNYQEIVFARKERGSLRKLDKRNLNDESFLTLISDSHFQINPLQGSEIHIEDESAIGKLISRHANNATFNCTFTPRQNYLDEDGYAYFNIHFAAWRTLAVNKYDDPVAGAFVPHGNVKGWVFILPQLTNKADFLLEFIRDVLPEFAPELFPYADGEQWVHQEAYQLPFVLEMKRQIQEIEKETRSRIEELEERIRQELETTRYLRDLITQTGDSLVKAVKLTLETLGFQNVIDVDEDIEKSGGRSFKREDLQINEDQITILVEIKGINGLPTDADALQVHKYVVVRMKEWKRTSVQGLEIINHQRSLPALNRELAKPFRDDVLTNAEHLQFGLMTTWDLYRLARNFIRHKWRPEYVKGLFLQAGRIEPVPSHYKLIGSVERYLDKIRVVGIRIGAEALRVGDHVAFEMPIDFEEQEVASLQLDHTPVMTAEPPALAGIKTHLEKVNIGTKVYLVQKLDA